MLIDSSTLKPYIIVLLILVLLDFVLVLVTVILQYTKNYVGFLLGNGSTYLCSVYLTVKMEYARENILDAAFAGGIITVILSVAMAAELGFLLFQVLKQAKKDNIDETNTFNAHLQQ